VESFARVATTSVPGALAGHAASACTTRREGRTSSATFFTRMG
jgi:hypothetical protein